MAPKKKDSPVHHILGPQAGAIDFSGQSICIKVGSPDTATTFHANETLLRNNSPFFAAAMKKQWREGQNRIVELPEQAPEPFNLWLNWLYCRCVALAPPLDQNLKSTTVWSKWIRAYALGDAVMDFDFKDAVLDAFVGLMDVRSQEVFWVPNTKNRAMMYETTTAPSKLREALVCALANCKGLHLFLSNEDEDPTLLLDLTKYLSKSWGKERSYSKIVEAAERCEFHEHKSGNENCYRTKFSTSFSC